MVDAELDRPAQDRAGAVGVARRTEDAGAGELHRAEADPADRLVAEHPSRDVCVLVMRRVCASVAPRTRRASILGLAPPPTRREELAEFLRHLRERTTPESVGLPANGRPRTPGLRREEVSDLAGVPVPAPAGPYPTAAPPELAACIAALEPLPAHLLNPRADVLAWNAGAESVIGSPTDAPDGRRNLLWWLFTEPGRGNGPRDATARLTLARFRFAFARRYDDPAFHSLIGALLAASPAFRELWPRHEVREAQLGNKVIDHPRLGRLSLLHLQSIPTSHPDLRLTQFVPADEPTRQALKRS